MDLCCVTGDLPLTSHTISHNVHTLFPHRDLPLTSYTGKVYSLLVSEFRHVLMIDADCMPVQVRMRAEGRHNA